jgi:hypothetical protein
MTFQVFWVTEAVEGLAAIWLTASDAAQSRSQLT